MRLVVVGIGQCGSRIADEFARLGKMASSGRGIQIITGSDGSFAGFLNPQRPLALGLAGVFGLVWISAAVVGIRRKDKLDIRNQISN